MTCLRWAAGFALTGILTVLTYTYLTDVSASHGFSYWLFLTLIVACILAAFCAIPYTLVRSMSGRR